MQRTDGASDAVVDRSFWMRGGSTGFLLIHGLGGTPVELRFVAHGLSQAGYTVFCPQLAGHCQGEEALRLSRWQEWCQSVEAAHAEIIKTCDTVIVGGLSMGGLLGLHLARQSSRHVDGVVAFAPTLQLDGWSVPWIWQQILSRIRPIGRWRSHFKVTERPPYGLKDERIRAFVLKHMQSGDSGVAGTFSTPVHALAEFNAFAMGVKRDLAHIKSPTLILHPRDDDMASLENAHYLQRHLGGLVDLVVLDDSYHMITLDRQRHLVVERTLAFAEGIVRAKKAAIARIATIKPTTAAE